MHKEITRTKIVTSLGALALGVALSSVPAMAQYGRSANDGGLVTVSGAQPQAAAAQYYNYAAGQPTAYKYPLGRSANDGGLVAEPAGAPIPLAHAVSHAASAPHYGRSPNDGGLVD